MVDLYHVLSIDYIILHMILYGSTTYAFSSGSTVNISLSDQDMQTRTLLWLLLGVRLLVNELKLTNKLSKLYNGTLEICHGNDCCSGHGNDLRGAVRLRAAA